MCNIAPAIAGDASRPSLWPSLRDKAFGADLLQLDTEEGGWTHFFAKGGPMAAELASEIERMKGLYHQACRDAGCEPDPAHPVLGAPSRTFGIGKERMHYQCFDAIRTKRAEGLKRRAEDLPRDDQRGIAFIQSAGDPFSNVLFSSMPDAKRPLNTEEFWSATQNKLGLPQSACATLIGKPIKISGPNQEVDLFGNNVKSATRVTGDGHRTLHNIMVDVMSRTLAASGVPHRGGNSGKPRHCKDVFSAQVGSLPDGQERVLQKIIPDTIIDARNLVTADAGCGKAILGKRSLSDNKMLTRGGSSSAYVTAPLEQGAAVNGRQRRGASDYEKRARELDRQVPGHQPDEEGPFTKELKSYGDNGRVLIPVVGAFVEMSSDAHAIADLCASLQADRYCANYRSQPAAVRGMFRQRIYRTWGMRMHQGWARLLHDRLQDLVINPEAKRHSRAYSRDHETSAFEEDAFNNPNRATSYAMRG